MKIGGNEMSKKPVSVAISEKTLQEIDTIVLQKGGSRSQLIEGILQHYLKYCSTHDIDHTPQFGADWQNLGPEKKKTPPVDVAKLF